MDLVLDAPDFGLEETEAGLEEAEADLEALACDALALDGGSDSSLVSRRGPEESSSESTWMGLRVTFFLAMEMCCA